MKDYYAILEIPFGADISDVKRAYRRLALKYHPDKNKAPDAARKFIQITEAYEILRDPRRKEQYDLQFPRHQSQGMPVSYDANFEDHYQEWREEAHAKARQDSSIPYDAFARRISREVKLGVSYVPNLIAMFFTGSGAITMLAMVPAMAEDMGGGGAVFLIAMAAGLLALTYKLFGVMRSDYVEDRKRTF